MKKIGILFTLSAITINFAFAQQKNQMHYKKTGPVYFINKEGKEIILTVSVTKNETKLSSTLLLFDAETTQLLNKKGIAADSISYEQVIGCMKNILWIYKDSLVGYDVNTLEPAVTETMIAAKNPFMQNNFSKYTNAYLLDESAEVMYITADNSERYKLYPSDFVMKQDETQSDPPKDENFLYEFAAEYKVNDRYELKYAVSNIDTSNNMLYILGSEKETSQVLSYYGSNVYADRDEPRQLTIIPFKLNGEKIDYTNNKPITSASKYFKGAFLRQKFSLLVWKGNDGERIILFETNKKLSIALIDKTGSEKWKINSNYFFNNFNDYLISNKHLAIWFTGKEDSIISIDLNNGKLTTIQTQVK